jgi:hydroxymethylpyrimidine pyrophosphatase-like HAD family hydrolase
MQPASVVAMGDDGNDIDMLRDFGGFAMAGSANAVLEAGRGVASSVGEIVRRFL